MCGIAGLIDFAGGPVSLPALSGMLGCLAHRGPDGDGMAALTHRAEGCVALASDTAPPAGAPAAFAHRRLAIIDLSEAGRQPMSSADGSVWISFNGEVFNYLELRQELQGLGRRFTTQSDTEVLLQAWEQWGPDCLPRLNGMWAFAVWDTRRRQVFLAVDRFGIKPLYYASAGRRLAFASEPNALLTLDWISADPDDRAIADYLVHSREDCFEWTFFRQIKRLQPGACLLADFDAVTLPAPRTWWDLKATLTTPPTSDDAAQAQFRELFESAVRLRLRSDVPVGTCLSGGLDSSAVVCVARPWLAEENQRTYSAVYDASFDLDETRFIDEVVQHTGVQNYRTMPSGESLLADLGDLVRCQGEPFGSTSQYAQMKVFELVRQHGTKVTLDGQGCDEELAGYHYFFPVHIAGLIQAGRFGTAWREFAAQRRLTGAPLLSSGLAVGAGFLSHRAMIRWANRYDPSRTVAWVPPHLRALARSIEQPPASGLHGALNRRLEEVFAVSSLPALLRYEDRNSMRYGVEARLPFLDHRLVSFLFSLPAEQKIRGGWTKYVMREAMRGTIPESIRMRSDKIGFATPEASWFGSSVLPLMRREFKAASTASRGCFDVPRLLALLERNAAGRVRAGRALWRALNLELWFREFID